MKHFHFPLRPIAILRAHHEMRAREAFSAAVYAFTVAEQQLAAARARVRDLAGALTAARRERVSGQRQCEALAAFRSECAVEAAAAEGVRAAQAAMDARRCEYVDAHRKLEVVRRLEEKAYAAHRQAVMREEQAEFDEFATQRFGRHFLNSA